MGYRALDLLEKSIFENDLTTDEINRRREALKKPSALLSEIKNIAGRLPIENDDKQTSYVPEQRLVDPESPPAGLIEIETDFDLLDTTLEMSSLFEALMFLIMLPKNNILSPDDCPLCLEDNTLEHPFKGAPFKLDRHLKTKTHTKKEFCKRKYSYLEKQSKDGTLAWPWGCDVCFVECYSSFRAFTNFPVLDH
jgi:hypothetical protein